MTWFRILALSLLVMALAMPMRLHGLMAMPEHAAHHASHQPGQPAVSAIPCHETARHETARHEAGLAHPALPDEPLLPAPMDAPERPVTSGGHASLHCATAGLVVPSRLVDLPLPGLAMFEALAPAEMPLAEGIAPPRQERPPRNRS